MTRSAPAHDPPRICHLSTVHPADDTRVFWREAAGLAQRGFRVMLIARSDRDGMRHGVRIVALPTYRSRIVRMSIGVTRALRLAWRARADIYHAHDPELIPALALLRLAGRRVVYDAHELLSRQVRSKRYLPRPVRRPMVGAVRALEWFVGRVVHRVVTVSEACAAVFPAGKVSIVANYPELATFAAPAAHRGDADRTAGQRPVVFGYLGGLTASRGAAQLVDAVRIVAASAPVRLRIVGSISPRSLEESLRDRAGWRQVDLVGAVAHDEVAERLMDCRAGLVTFLPTPNNVIGSPNKLFEYMAMGLPVIASDFPAWREMLDGVDCALFVDPSDPAAIAAAMQQLIADPQRAIEMGAAGRAAVEERFNWGRQLDELVAAYASIGIVPPRPAVPAGGRD